MNAKSIQGKSVADIQTALQQSIVDGFTPTLAITFLSVSQDRRAICKLLDKHDVAVYGITTNGEFINEEPEIGSIAILLLDVNKEYFEIYVDQYPEKNYRDVARGIAQKAKGKFGVPAFLVAGSHIETDAEELLFGFADVVGEQVNVFGGMAGDDYSFKQQFIFTTGKESDRGVIALALDENKIKITGKATCGWKAIGTERTVTRSEGNHIYTIDNIPALDITTKYSGLENLVPENEGLAMELTNFPLQLQRKDGDPVMRPALMIDWSDHSFYCSGSVPQGAKVRFSLPPDFDVMEQVITGVEKMKATEMPEADAVVIFSCAGRNMALGPLMSMEIEGVNNVWDVPMVGMFSNAELGRATGGNLEMHNLTTCVVALKER